MKIALFEHFTSLPAATADAGLVREGRAIRDAVADDLRRLPGIEVVIVDDRRNFGAALRACEAASVIAPEQGRRLERLSLRVETAGRLLLGPSSKIVRLAGDKLWTARRLAEVGVATPTTESVRFSEARRRLSERTLPFVVKPRDGCGGRGVVVVHRRRDLRAAIQRVRRATLRSDFLVQDYVEGIAASVSIIAGARLLDLGLNRQRLRQGATVEYLGGETFWPHRAAVQARAAARAAIAALSVNGPLPRGHFGVDLVLGPERPTVIEVNPRLTTSYVGLRRSIRENLAGLMLRAALGETLPRRVTRVARFRFRADGVTRARRSPWREGWPTRSVGTSAASI